MRILGAIVEPAADLLAIGVADLSHRRRVSTKSVGDDLPRSAVLLHDALEKLHRRRLVSLRSDDRFQDLAFMVDSAPEIAELSIDLHKHLVQMPPPLRIAVYVRDPLLSDLGGEHRTKPVPPKPDGLIADVDPALGQEILDVAQRQRVSHVHHHDKTDDLRRAVKISDLPRSEAPRAFGLTEPVDGLLCAEAGGINSTTPFVASAATGLPLIDGDGMGRAFPELQMTTFGMHGVSATPMVLGDDKGNSVVLETIDNRWTERLARSATVEMGGSALLAFYPMSGAAAKKAIVRGTLTLCADLGQKLREARARHEDPIEAVRAALAAEIIFNGRVKDVLRRTVGGFARGEAEIEGLDEHRGHKLRIAFQNEFLIAERDGTTMVTTPDMITLLEAETGTPVTADAMRYGIRVVALAYPSSEQWRTPRGLKLVGPRYFGYDLEFHPFTPGAARQPGPA